MTDPIRLARPDVGDAELAALAEVVGTGQLTMGPKVEEFEASIASAVGTAHAAAVSSGTAALHLALLALEIGPGDEVIVPAYTFPATANAVELCGAHAVLVDVDPDTFNIDVAAVAAAVTPRTRAVMAVHLFGRPVEWESLQTAVPQEVTLIEDAAGALGASYRGTPCGALGVAACLSFHPRKIVTTGEGGAVTTDEADLDASVRRFRHHGWATLGDMPVPGFNYRLPDLLCAIGIPQLARLEELLSHASGSPRWYTDRLEHLVLTPSAADGGSPRLAGIRRSDWIVATKLSPRSVLPASRRRSGRGRCTTLRRIALRATSRAPTAHSTGRWRSRWRRQRPRTRSNALRRS